MSTIEWGTLYTQGRVKEIGINWTDEDWKALKLGIPAEYVRKGILTLEDYEKNKNNISFDNKKELIEKLKDYGVEAAEETPIAVIKEEIKRMEDKNNIKEEVKEKSKQSNRKRVINQ